MNEEEEDLERNFRLVSIGTPRADVMEDTKIFFPEISKPQVIVL